MKTALSIAALGALLAAPGLCFALGSTMQISKEDAKRMGMEVRSTALGTNQVRVELEINVKGELKNFKRVDLQLGEGDNPPLAAQLHEDRSKPGQVAASFTADRAHLDKITLRVTISEAGDQVYKLRIKDFIEPTQEAPARGDKKNYVMPSLGVIPPSYPIPFASTRKGVGEPEKNGLMAPAKRTYVMPSEGKYVPPLYPFPFSWTGEYWVPTEGVPLLYPFTPNLPKTKTTPPPHRDKGIRESN